METPSENPNTWTGTSRSVVVPSPNRPCEFLPQHHAVQSFFTAQVLAPVQATVTAPVIPEVCTGTLLFVWVPSPNWPTLLAPQHQTVPSFLTAQV